MKGNFKNNFNNVLLSNKVLLRFAVLAIMNIVLWFGFYHHLDQLPTTTTTTTTPIIITSTLLDLPAGTKSIVLNIGSNVDPILPQTQAGPCAITLAFEPIVPDKIPKHPQVLVVPAAVSDATFLSTMYVYNTNGASSSLSQPLKPGSWWNSDPGEPRVVPVIPLQTVLAAIPKHVTIDMVDTDMQGYDFRAVSSAVEALKDRGVKYLKTEVHVNNTEYGYQGTENDICRQWLPFMTAHGYHLVDIVVAGKAFAGYHGTAEAVLTCQTKHTAEYAEGDALWVLIPKAAVLDGVSAVSNDIDFTAPPFQYSTLRINQAPAFTEAEYAACRQK